MRLELVDRGWRIASRTALRLCALSLLGGCSLYHHEFPDGPPLDPGYDLRTVQFDDFGSFWDSDKAQKTLEDIEAQSQSLTSSTYVVVFVHGWHNNAAPDNANLLQFSHWLTQLSAELSKEDRRAARLELTGSAEFKLFGIFIGWRGRSLPGWLDYGTMWGRKTAAETVGAGDLSEFLERLQRIYLHANAYNRYREHPGNTPFTGLFTVGHSFGGQAVLRAVARPLEEALIERAPAVTDAVSRRATPDHRTPVTKPIDSFGDLNVLVNPATEAYQYSRIEDLYRQCDFPSGQTPQLVVFSADNDVPRKTFFPIARALTSPTRPFFRTAYQGSLWGKALGEFEPQRTHELHEIDGEADSLDDEVFKPENRHLIEDFDFTGTTVFSGGKLTRLSGAPAIANSPVAVIYTHDKIIDGHNGVFDTYFLDFLSKYVAYIEGKRIVLRFDDLKRQKAEEDRGRPTAP